MFTRIKNLFSFKPKTQYLVYAGDNKNIVAANNVKDALLAGDHVVVIPPGVSVQNTY